MIGESEKGILKNNGGIAMEREPRMKQFFVLILLSVFCFGLLCISGCGGTSCETIKCGSYEDGDSYAKGISVPGCGGCFTSGRGCDSCLWSQSNKITCASIKEGAGVTGNLEKIQLVGCDTRYYDGGCLGCGQREKSCYSGVYTTNTENWGIFIGSTDSGEKYLGCTDGCGGCYAANDPVLGETLQVMEIIEEID